MSGVGNAGLKLIHADTGIKSCPHRATPSIGSEQNLAVTLIVETRKRNLRASSGHVVNCVSHQCTSESQTTGNTSLWQHP